MKVPSHVNVGDSFTRGLSLAISLLALLLANRTAIAASIEFGPARPTALPNLSGPRIRPVIAAGDDGSWAMVYRDGVHFPGLARTNDLNVWNLVSFLPPIEASRSDLTFAGTKPITAWRESAGCPPADGERKVRVGSVTSPGSTIAPHDVQCFKPYSNDPNNPEGTPQIAACGELAVTVWHEGGGSDPKVFFSTTSNANATAPNWALGIPITSGRLPHISVDCASSNPTWLLLFENQNLELSYLIETGPLPSFSSSAVHSTGHSIDLDRPKAAGWNSRWVLAWRSTASSGISDPHISWLSANTATLTGIGSLPAPKMMNGPSPSSLYDMHPDIDTDGETWAIVWTSSDQADTAKDIAYSFGTGEPLEFSTPRAVVQESNTVNGNKRFPTVSTDREGSWVVVFEYGGGGSEEIWQAKAGSCDSRRAERWQEFESCVQDQLAKFYLVGDSALSDSFGWCRAKLDQPLAGCPTPDCAASQSSCQCCQNRSCRFIDTGRTIRDLLTELVWEKKRIPAANSSVETCPGLAECAYDTTDNGGSIHLANHVYFWTGQTTPTTFLEDGGAFTHFLNELNVNKFEGSSGWRMPTFPELLSTLDASSSGSLAHEQLRCIDPSFEATTAPTNWYWSGTNSFHEPSKSSAWYVAYGAPANIGVAGKVGAARRVRAVRGGF